MEAQEITTEELLKTLDKDSLLAIVQLLSCALAFPHEPLEDLELISSCFMTDAVFDYCKDLEDHQRLRLMQLIVNTLVAEAETTHFNNTQLALPL